MTTYKLQINSLTNMPNSVSCSDGWTIPFDSGNTDYQRFKKQIQGIGEFGTSITPVELQDADGNTMTEEEVAEFIATLS